MQNVVSQLNSIGFGADFVNKGTEQEQIRLIKKAIDLGINVFDTAEVYSEGRSEEILGKAIRGQREKVFISTKFSPHNTNYKSILQSCEMSLKRLKIDYINLYQIHWPFPNSNYEISRAYEKLIDQGKVLKVGVCNYHKKQIVELNSLLDKKLYSNQIEYNLFDRFAENKILEYCLENDMKIFAYSPLNKCRKLLDNVLVVKFSKKYGKTPAQILLNWLTNKVNIIALPKTNNFNNLVSNSSANKFVMEEKDHAALEAEKWDVQLVDTKKIVVSVNGEDNRAVYTTLEQAKYNKLKFSPSPEELSTMINEDDIKPVRLEYKESEKIFYLVEGRVRYWSWVIKNGFEKEIPSLIYRS